MRIGVNVEAAQRLKSDKRSLGLRRRLRPAHAAPALDDLNRRRIPFGVDLNEIAHEEEGGQAITQAGAHPFQLTRTIVLNQGPTSTRCRPAPNPSSPPALAKDVDVKLPPGLIGNATAIPQCSTASSSKTGEGKENRCPPDTAVGVAVMTVNEPSTVGTATVTLPMFNLQPRDGEPARFGFYVVIANSPVFIDTTVRTGDDYGVTVDVSNITQTAGFLSSEMTFWGVPGDSRHDAQRGWGCIYEARKATVEEPALHALWRSPPQALPDAAHLLQAPLQTSIERDSWSAPGAFQDFTGAFEPAAPLEGCDRLPFAPEIKVAPDGH